MDESTDVSVQKNLCILVRYFSISAKAIVTKFLRLFPVQGATGENIFNVIFQEITACGLLFENCIGYGSDGAYNMVGIRNSVWSRLQEVAPGCILFKCVCHSLALCIQHAIDKLPSCVGFLICEIPNWFRNSDLRRELYKKLCARFNGTDDP